MPAQNFSIPGESTTFQFEVQISGGELISISAVDTNGKHYDCKLQLTQLEDSSKIFCCRPEICGPGNC